MVGSWSSAAVARVAFVLFVGAVSTSGCKTVRHSPPLEAFKKDPLHEMLVDKSAAPPELSRRPWQVLALQVEPRPVKNPHWKPIPIEAAGELEMPTGSAFQCIYNPATMRPIVAENLKTADGWEVYREVRCSNDHWKSIASTGLKITYDNDGKVRLRSGERAELDLEEKILGRLTKVAVLLKADPSSKPEAP